MTVQRPPSPASVLAEVEAAARLAGHQNDGFLSISHGFLPTSAPLRALPDAFRGWDTLAAETPALLREQRFRAACDAMPTLDPAPDALPDAYLHRAAILLGFFAHGYARAEDPFVPQDGLPRSILRPWEIVCRRLGRPVTVLTYFDLVGYNWRLKDESDETRRLEGMELLYPIYDCVEERVLYLTQTEMIAESAPMIGLVAACHDAMAAGDTGRLAGCLDQMTERMVHVSRVSFDKITTARTSPNRMDPVVFAKTMMSFAVPIAPGVPGPSGTAFPTAHLVDVAFGRSRYDTRIGRDALEVRALFPPAVRRYLAAVAERPIPSFVAERRDPRLTRACDAFLDAYCGNDGFLESHRRKIFGFLQTAFQVGRAQTVGGFAGVGFEQTPWRDADAQLAQARRERG